MQDNKTPETEKLQAENETLKQLLEKYQRDALLKNMEQKGLEEKVTSVAEAKSYYDLQTEELKYVRNYINELMQKAESAAQREAELEKQVTQSISTAHQLEDVKVKYNYLQVQLNDLAERLQQLNNQNILQSQYASRIAELESMLANAEEEIELLKNPSEAES
jgi:DNA repair exonuclease SbcCD ATPase subunit